MVITSQPFFTFGDHLANRILFSNPAFWDEVTFPSEIVKKELINYIGRKLTPNPTKIRADVEVTCFKYAGINAIKDSLRAAEAKNTPDNTVKVRLVAPPLYVMTCTILDREQGIHRLQEAIEEVTEKIKTYGGNCSVRMAPKAVTEHDDAELKRLMEQREKENQEVSGDEDESESDEGNIH